MDRQNPWWNGEPDFKYMEWKNSEIKWVPKVIEEISLRPFSLNFIFGPRQVGKTTAVKILIHRLLEKEDPMSVFYFSCDELTDYRELGEILDAYISARKARGIDSSFIFLDEVTFVEEWWRAIKSRIDSGDMKNDVVTVTGSASMSLMKQKEFFPGRRGMGRDHIIMPLSFSEYVAITRGVEPVTGGMEDIEKNVKGNVIHTSLLKDAMNSYLVSGGFPLAVRDFHRYGTVSPETMKTYLDWVRGDWNRAGKSEKYMKEILAYVMRAKGTPISWNGIASETGVNSPNTTRSYVEVLEGTFSALILHMLSPDSRILYRKNKKIHFTDPLLFRIFSEYTKVELSTDWLMEGVAASILGRRCDIFYWRNSTETDIVCLQEGKQIGFEVTTGIKKWKKPRHIHKAYLLDRENIHLYLASL